MTKKMVLNNDWKFSTLYKEEMLEASYDAGDLESVRIPHSVVETPLHYFDDQDYQMVSGYRRCLDIPEEWEGKVLLLTFAGIAHSAEVYLNGCKVAEHHCGYTAFTADISEAAQYGACNTLVVKVDSRENQNIPPFGFVIDYMTYGGIYRDVWLEVKEPSYLADLFLTTKQAQRFPKSGAPEVICCERSQVTVRAQIIHADEKMELRHWMRAKGGEFELAGTEAVLPMPGAENDQMETETSLFTGKIELWDLNHPALYEWKTELVKDGQVLDEKIVTYGYRKAVFKKEGFYLNGRKVKICGLNRHQSYAYVGYAMPASMQRLDAEILKNELGLNAVRTSHYPQSQHFIDRCDELGLLVFTEIPGWQHIGDEAWKDQAVKNVEEMVLQYRNHPSIILWGVRINESPDDDAFYERTNALARKLDPSRPTGGVRCFKKSSLLEDVYTYNDFVHSGKNRGCDEKELVTSDPDKAYMVTEYNGHMFPTKAFDWEEHRLEHALRHARVVNDIAAQPDIAGSFGWCMVDYNTHKDFGSGDRICYHGVMDMFRNPKMAASVYASRLENTPVLQVSSSMDIGEHPASHRGYSYIFTNADSVRMYRNDRLLKEYRNENPEFAALGHPPIRIDDYIGDVLETEEHMPHKQAMEVKAILNEVAVFGPDKMTKSAWMKAGKMMLLYHMTMDDAIQLFNKYVGDWGGEATVYRFDAVKDGKVVKSVTKGPVHKMSLELVTDHTDLKDEHTYDVAAVRIRAVDEFGNVLPYYNEPVILETEGEIELIGPGTLALSGGMAGTYVKTKGKAGNAVLRVKNLYGVEESVSFTVSI
ncbi:MAG: glycoside hydrolase family 2 protein [Lachnospiraceae bacterium]|nr:glycoside hydrolase family 2 protein [Lachnospiraceae bacterium]